MARIAGINIPQNKVVSIALTYIHGIGLHSSKIICKKLEIPSIDGNKYLNRSTHSAYTKYYCDESFEKVTKKMQLDLNYFNYDFG